jgi:hypothetical protein
MLECPFQRGRTSKMPLLERTKLPLLVYSSLPPVPFLSKGDKRWRRAMAAHMGRLLLLAWTVETGILAWTVFRCAYSGNWNGHIVGEVGAFEMGIVAWSSAGILEVCPRWNGHSSVNHLSVCIYSKPRLRWVKQKNAHSCYSQLPRKSYTVSTQLP